MAVKGKWAQGIEPRNFRWVIKGSLAVCERPGGYGSNHRRVRRQEEIIWVREQGFAPVISIVASPANLHNYDELGRHVAAPSVRQPRRLRHRTCDAFYPELKALLAVPDAKVLIHGEELGDRLSGLIAGYLVWTGLVPSGPKAISLIERLLHRQLGPPAVNSSPWPWSSRAMPETPTGGSVDLIELRGLQVIGICGALPEERDRAQPLEIDLDVEADLGAVGRVRRPRRHRRLRRHLRCRRGHGRGGEPQLLEHLAAEIAAAVLGRRRTGRRGHRHRAQAAATRAPRTGQLGRADPPPGMTRAFLSLGSNLGDRRQFLSDAVGSLGSSVVAVSPVYETDPVGGPDQGRFLNLVVQLETDLSPRELLAVCHRLESAAQRVRMQRWGPRTLDVDIIWIDGVTVDEPDLVIPHPRWSERNFVLAPLADLAPELVDPDVYDRAHGQVHRVEPLAGWETEAS